VLIDAVGLNNHRQFLIFVLTLVIGVILFDYLVYEYFTSIEITEQPSTSCILTESLCSIAAHDTFLVSVSAWATLQLLWTSILLLSQLWQVARQMTTFEVSNLGRFGFMGGRGGTLGSQMGHRHQTLALPPSDDGISQQSGSAAHGHGGHAHAHNGGCTGLLMQLTGLDVFTRGRAADGLARASKATNPFDLGIIANCKDFWTKGQEVGVEYERLYDIPSDGLREANRRRVREEEEDGVHGRKQKPGHFMGFNLGLGRSNRGGYEPVSQV